MKKKKYISLYPVLVNGRFTDEPSTNSVSDYVQMLTNCENLAWDRCIYSDARVKMCEKIVRQCYAEMITAASASLDRALSDQKNAHKVFDNARSERQAAEYAAQN